MSQGNWGGGGGPGGGWGGQGGGGFGPPGGGQPPGGGGYGPPPGGQPPGGGGYGQPPGGQPPGGGYGPPPGGQPPGGGYGPPPGGQPQGGFGPPGGQPPGGYGPPGGGYGPPPGGQPPGYGPPPGGGGYGAPPGGYGGPPGGGGYGPPPGPGAPPGGPGWGGPPGGGYGGSMGAQGAMGMRAVFSGDGGKLFATYLLYWMAPLFGAAFVFFVLTTIGSLLDRAVRSGGVIAIPFTLLGGLVMIAAYIAVPLVFMNKFLGFYYEALTLDGQRCNYVGTVGDLLKSQFVNVLLIAITFGIYTPWALVNLKKWTYENVEVGGQRGRLTFDGDGGTLFGTYLLGMILTYCTFGIYGAWLANDIFAFYWDNTKLDGRGFSFKKDPGGFLGTYILTVILCMCTLYIYLPWGICNLFKWEAERVT
jgi:Bacterial protein of unknown function (DUF898)